MRLPLLLFFIIALVGLLHWQFPYALSGTDRQMRLVYLVLLALVIGGRSRLFSRTSRQRKLRDMLLWIGIMLLLMLMYNLRKYVI